MKSKRLIALALTAALASSAVCFSGAGAIKAYAAEDETTTEETATEETTTEETASAAVDLSNVKVTYDDTLPYQERVAHVHISSSDVQGSIIYFAKKNPKGCYTYGDLKEAWFKPKTYPDLHTGKFLGWAQTKEDAEAKKALKDDDPIYMNAASKSGVYDKSYSGGSIDWTFYPVYDDYESEAEYSELAEAAEKAATASKESQTRSEHCWGRAWRHSAGMSMLNSKGVRTGYNEKFYVGDAEKAYTKDQIESIKKAVGVDLDANEIAFVYEVGVNVRSDNAGYTLIDGMNMMVRLMLPDEYTTKGYVVNVFHVPHTGPEKVTNLDIGTYDVMFFARDFSPYVLVMTPGKVEKYENPPTADASAIPVALLAAASLSATGAMLMRRKRELGE